MSRRAGVRRLGALSVAALVAAMALFFGGTARAGEPPCTTTPTTNAALQADVSGGSAGDVICLVAGQQYSPSATLDVNHNLTIETDPTALASGGKAGILSGGSMTTASTIDSGQLDVLAVNTGVTLTLSNIVETQAIQPSSGGIVALNGGTVNIDHSLLSGNTSAALDVMAGGTSTVTNTTIFGSINGFDGIALDGTATLNEDTIAGNAGNGIDKTTGATATVNNTILSGNALGNCNMTTGLSGSNDGDSGTSCGATITTGGFTNVSAGLGALANNGGPTNTLAITATSPAVGHGTGPGAGTDDQRGFFRTATPSIGAYEFNGAAPATLNVVKHVVGPGSASQFQMTVTGADANPTTFAGQEAPGTAVTVAGGQTYTVSEAPAAGSGVSLSNYTTAASGNCSGTNPITGSVPAGTSATCTITNTAKPMVLTVIKNVVNTGGGTAQPSDFTMIVTDTTTNTVLSSAAGSATGTQVNVPAGDNYSVTESGAQTSNYTESNGANCSGTATINGTASCTVTNTFIACTQPSNSGPQPGPGAPGSSSNTCVNATVATTILVTSPSLVAIGPVAAGSSSAPVSVPVNVKSNDPAGYQLSVGRTVFTNGDLGLSISGNTVSTPQVYDPLPGTTTLALTPIPTVGATLPNLNIGETSAAITPVGGDNWPLNFVLTVPFGVPAGQHQSTVTFTAIAK